MTKANRRQISLYEEAKTGLSSFLWQTLWGFLGVMMMLLLTGGNPPGFIVALSFCVGVGFVAWSEKNRLAELPSSSEIQSEENFTNASNRLENSSLSKSESQLSRDISPNQRAIIEIIRKKFEPFLSEQELNYRLQQIENAQTEKLSELAAIAGLNLAQNWRISIDTINLSGDNLSGVNLSRANLYGANLSEADLSEADLSEADLIKVNLSGANLIKANLSRANLSEANLIRANLIKANLSRANLSGANLIGADLIEANLSGVDLSETDLSGVDLNEANLSQTDLSGAIVTKTIFGHNIGISDLIKSDLIKRGAIFEDSPGETSEVPTRV